MKWGNRVWLWAGIILGSCVAQAAAQYSVEIDLQRQTAYLIRGNRVVLASPISSGRSGHLTETGSFKIIEKELNHYSSLYGRIVDASGRTVVSDADADMKVLRGGRFIPAPMRYFMRFHARPECTRDISPVTRPHTAVCECRNKMPSSSFGRSRLGRRFASSEERRAHASTSSTVRSHRGGRHTIAVMIRDTILASEIRVTIRDMRRRQIGGTIKD
jgi:hypothetical protein